MTGRDQDGGGRDRAGDETLTPDTITCSSEYASGWCNAVADGHAGTCNAGEWATAGHETGWVRLEWDSPVTVNAVTVFDRACGERVMGGHVTFDDGSPDVTFGALDDDGSTGSMVGFSPRTITAATVHIDRVEGVNPWSPNPGLGEITFSGAAGTTATRDVLVLDFDPVVFGQPAHLHYGWAVADQRALDYRDSLPMVTGGQYAYDIVDTVQIPEFPVKEDGFVYTQATYDACIANEDNCHDPDKMDYLAVIEANHVCERVNSGEIDEVWMFGGPAFGFRESILAGPRGYQYNSNPVIGTICERLVPIMGFNVGREFDAMLHDLGHRTEATMTRVYGSWSQDSL
ncbi:MAG: hypothetical protein K0V04_04125, partial [Deltaproteobacteria bacterium]|nr:hypothetical protein [Deltaproteobacteria bacterium]